MDEQATPSPENNLSATLGSLLSNPTLMQSIGSLLGNASTEPPTAASSPTPPTDGLAKALADPELMAKLPQVMAMLQPMLTNSPSTPSDASVPTIASQKSNSTRSDCRDDLLIALKPFLSPARCEAVDTIIRLSKLGHVLQHLQ